MCCDRDIYMVSTMALYNTYVYTQIGCMSIDPLALEIYLASGVYTYWLADNGCANKAYAVEAHICTATQN